MAEEESIQDSINEFERTRMQLMNISAQKQQLQMQSSALGDALKELEKTKEKKVYKAVGNILILSPADRVKKEVTEQKESIELRVKTLQKQEDISIEKLNKLKHRIETKSGSAEAKEQEETG